MDPDERPAKMRKLEPREDKYILMDEDVATTTTNDQPSRTTDQDDLMLASEGVPGVSTEEPKLSKNQLKKKRRLEQWEAGREDRKVKRKEKAKEKKERKREAWKEQNVDENGNVLKMPPTRLPRHFPGHGTQVPITVIFDCEFEDLMYDHELKSLGLQITRCYSDNRKAKYRTHLALSSFGGKMKERFDGILAQQYTSWKGFQFFEEDFVAVAEKSGEWMAGLEGGEVAGALVQSKNTTEQTAAQSTERDEPTSVQTNGRDENLGQKLPAEGKAEVGEIIYLSSESDNVLTHLKPNSTYIIGGLVDKNRHKGICHKRAVERGIKTAKLPIKEYLEMRDRQVLVTNHVLEILLKWMEFGNWGKAFMEVMPKRKGGKLREDGGEDEANGDSQHGDEQDGQEKVDAAQEAVEDADGGKDVPETEVIKVTKGLPVGETEAD